MTRIRKKFYTKARLKRVRCESAHGLALWKVGSQGGQKRAHRLVTWLPYLPGYLAIDLLDFSKFAACTEQTDQLSCPLCAFRASPESAIWVRGEFSGGFVTRGHM